MVESSPGTGRGGLAEVLAGENAAEVLTRVPDGTTPCDGAWPAEEVAVLRRWAGSGAAP